MKIDARWQHPETVEDLLQLEWGEELEELNEPTTDDADDDAEEYVGRLPAPLTRRHYEYPED